ncbi:hypothetical protein L1987_09686 [Smallanthus sonchifolius]|uniref:Uncharacterized protein n=1 Tax=Smallanthus sonchifolius TaxID=185202 RepID=A0ACB9JQ20_9ASTR|nr:hypothetical protein L1987_09686 [Smallanthus sonchifolius]
MPVADVALTPILKRSGSGCFRSSESIVIFLTVAGSVIPMRIMDSDSIDYVVSSGDVLHLILRVSDLLVISVETTIGREFEFEVDRFRNVRYLKQLVLEKAKGVGIIDVEDHKILSNGERIDDHRLIDDVCNNHNGMIHLVVEQSTYKNPGKDEQDSNMKKPPEIDSPLQAIIVNPSSKLSTTIWSMLGSAFEGLKNWKKPIRSSEGTGGTYSMQHPSGNKYVAVFKPVDEEPMAVNNPQGLPVSTNGEGLKRGTKVGEVEEVHKITVFDIRTANADRHAGNILMNREGGRLVLIPIDHGYCLPENFEDCTFDWLYWPQAHEPYSPETLDYIETLDAERDLVLLGSNGWDLTRECARTLRISTMLLKKGAKRGLCPYAIRRILYRETLNKESVIEIIVQKACSFRLPGTTEADFLTIVSSLLDFELDKVSRKHV